jgi:hypothetical protein
MPQMTGPLWRVVCEGRRNVQDGPALFDGRDFVLLLGNGVSVDSVTELTSRIRSFISNSTAQYSVI